MQLEDFQPVDPASLDAYQLELLKQANGGYEALAERIVSQVPPCAHRTAALRAVVRIQDDIDSQHHASGCLLNGRPAQNMKPIRLSKKRGEYFKSVSMLMEAIAAADCTLDEWTQLINAAKQRRTDERVRLEKKAYRKKNRKISERDRRHMKALSAWHKAGDPPSGWRAFLDQPLSV